MKNVCGPIYKGFLGQLTGEDARPALGRDLAGVMLAESLKASVPRPPWNPDTDIAWG